VASGRAGMEETGVASGALAGLTSRAGMEGSDGAGAGVIREVGGWSTAAGVVATEAGLRGGVEEDGAGVDEPAVAGGVPADLTSRAGTEGSGGLAAMREVGVWSDVAGAGVAEAGFAGAVADGGAGVGRGCSGGVARKVTASRCEAEGTRDSGRREAGRAGGVAEEERTTGTDGTGGLPDETTAAGFAGGAPGAGVFVSAGSGAICAVGTSDGTEAGWMVNGRGGIVGGFDAAGS
jgi:hypothetical protein